MNKASVKPDGYDAYIKSSKWKNISKDLKKLAKGICQHCRHSSATLEVHHLTYERFRNERMSDLVVLCKPCHKIADEKRIAEREQRGLIARDEAAYSTYMEKKYGEEHHYFDDEQSRSEFSDWLDRKRDAECDPSYEPPNRYDNF